MQTGNPAHFCTIILYHVFQKFIQNSATRFNSCKFTRNSGTTRLRAAALARVVRRVRNGSSWKRGPSWPSVRVGTRLRPSVGAKLRIEWPEKLA